MPDVVDVIVDPVAIKMIHKARLYDEVKVAVKKKSKVTTKVLKKSVPQNMAKEEKASQSSSSK